ncbi:UDP-GlcNAc:betaGal beta-1,3-N-acetylglucosaminyltransferase-like protein 1 isoform X1 [Eriocheir sinensis]|uniref:UDP-GlcNAc:betaGal beta-1,3-N-acetylglucosaminyltransferase-like protein 1 isoform X1 n=1 Tax=Eriocheir sinensis TaxID=95602 RepID=UPI0021C57787|nr:UDP-GlcNAc:betaGal beta-1,3-N-acetylglucosaminyltransferase-like protein 1 isoform X1 [Eriocheir sinensis]XP_050692204.1 UDP-GlcNAc:betaGal beta-1,3-N-acetylglucosaminyltransferase-like protein 1 isoform X1 [Eriocheir sinensis]
MSQRELAGVSVIIPVHNGATWLDDCLASVLRQEYSANTQCPALEVSVFLDSCTDASEAVVDRWSAVLRNAGCCVTVKTEHNDKPRGVGYAKNRAVEQSQGEFLCFLDADDIMLPTRIQQQYELASKHHDAIVGSRFFRQPADSTARYTRWANTLTPLQLETQIYMSHGPTVIMPTWFCHRSVFDRVGGFSEEGAGTPEDLIFFFHHLRLGGRVLRHDDELLIYRYHPHATTFSVSEETIWDLRIREIEERVLSSWDGFTIWNAGKQGRRFYRSLSKESQRKVIAFCDVDAKKVGSVYTYEESAERPKPRVPIVHFTKARPPLIICMKMELTGGKFEENLASLFLQEATDYHLFN